MATLQNSTVADQTFGRGGGNQSSNTAFGRFALYNNGGYLKNAGLGTRTVQQGGHCNVGIGYRAAVYNAGSTKNTHVGRGAGANSYSNSNKTSIGAFAGYFQSPGAVSIGTTANPNNSNKDCSVAMGRYANCASRGVSVGFNAGQFRTAALTTTLAPFAGQYNTSNTANIAIGFYTSRFEGGAYNAINIGWYAYNHNGYSTPNQTSLGRANNRTGCIWTGWSNVSDDRDKTNISPLTDNLGINFVRKLRPVTFNWDKRIEYQDKCGFEYGVKDGTLVEEKEDYGFIAQEIDLAARQLGFKFDAVAYGDFQDAYSVSYLEFVAVLTKALQKINDDLDLIETHLNT
jgi:hypothetical protein